MCVNEGAVAGRGVYLAHCSKLATSVHPQRGMTCICPCLGWREGGTTRVAWCWRAVVNVTPRWRCAYPQRGWVTVPTHSAHKSWIRSWKRG